MLYIFNDKVSVRGYFEECMYDEAPEVGSYRREIVHTFARGNICSFDGNMPVTIDTNRYGVSVYGAKAYVTEDLLPYVENGTMRPISSKDAARVQELEEEIFEMTNSICCLEWAIEQDCEQSKEENVPLIETEEDYNKASNDLWQNAKLWIDSVSKRNQMNIVLESRRAELKGLFKRVMSVGKI